MKKHTLIPLLLSFILSLAFSVAAQAQYSTPTETVQTIMDDVFPILRAPGFSLAEDKQQIDEVITGAFDPNTIAQSALGASYRDFTREQRSEFEELFFAVLKSTFIDRLDSYTDETIELTGETQDGNRGSVTSIINASNSQIAVDFNLRQRPNGWFIYDIIVEEVSLLSSYRSTYRSIIRRSGIETLLEDLRQQADGA